MGGDNFKYKKQDTLRDVFKYKNQDTLRYAIGQQKRLKLTWFLSKDVLSILKDNVTLSFTQQLKSGLNADFVDKVSQ